MLQRHSKYQHAGNVCRGAEYFYFYFQYFFYFLFFILSIIIFYFYFYFLFYHLFDYVMHGRPDFI